MAIELHLKKAVKNGPSNTKPIIKLGTAEKGLSWVATECGYD